MVFERQLMIEQNTQIVCYISCLVVLLQYLSGTQRHDFFLLSLRTKYYDLLYYGLWHISSVLKIEHWFMLYGSRFKCHLRRSDILDFDTKR